MRSSRAAAEERPGLDGDFLAHGILAVFDGALVRHLATNGEPRRFTRSVQDLALAICGT
ncbi:hypothetical protein [Glycomyces dulcitolivorans]|uniref:hypothetical protein n=1 Tax=Glycomyces dulcitolivorans TaxID=2200759 RepID=UPI0013008744|nr:hypothetical protein [Glycomyces dulcitolivorans]